MVELVEIYCLKFTNFEDISKTGSYFKLRMDV